MMQTKRTVATGLTVICVAALAAAGPPLLAQSAGARTTATAAAYSAPCTPWGHPEDAAVWTRPWTYSMPLTKVNETQQMYEYACHEGNHAMRNILSAARAPEQGTGQR